MPGIVGEGPLTCTLTGEKTHRGEVGYCTNAAGTDIMRQCCGVQLLRASTRTPGIVCWQLDMRISWLWLFAASAKNRNG